MLSGIRYLIKRGKKVSTASINTSTLLHITNIGYIKSLLFCYGSSGSRMWGHGLDRAGSG
jgi:hypothetical protein